jgi:hypothetical protein
LKNLGFICPLAGHPRFKTGNLQKKKILSTFRVLIELEKPGYSLFDSDEKFNELMWDIRNKFSGIIRNVESVLVTKDYGLNYRVPFPE